MLQCIGALGGRDEVGHARSTCKFVSWKTDFESEWMLAEFRVCQLTAVEHGIDTMPMMEIYFLQLHFVLVSSA